MAVLSKLFVNALRFDAMHANCYETIHVWNPNCWGSLLDIVPAGIKFCLKTYIVFYVVSALIKVKDPRKIDLKKLVKDILRSSTFLLMNMLFLLYAICWVHHRVGFVTWPSISFIPAIMASFFAILIESPARRPMLALYLLNLASETLFRQLVSHGYLRFIRNGECLVFAAGLTILSYFSKHANEKRDFMTTVLKNTHYLEYSQDAIDLKSIPPRVSSWFNELRNNFTRHRCCDHNNSCLSTAVESGARNFTYGLAGSLALAVLKSVRSPTRLLRNVFNLDVLRLPLFAAALPLIYHGTECGLVRYFNRKTEVMSYAASAASGAAMLVYPSTTIAMYFLWKSLEMVYFKLVESGKAPHFKHGEAIVYALSAGFVFGNVIIEPHVVRKGYLNFLRGLTGGKLDLFNRRLFYRFGFDSNKMYKQYIPQLDLKHVTINPSFYLPVIKSF